MHTRQQTGHKLPWNYEETAQLFNSAACNIRALVVITTWPTWSGPVLTTLARSPTQVTKQHDISRDTHSSRHSWMQDGKHDTKLPWNRLNLRFFSVASKKKKFTMRAEWYAHAQTTAASLRTPLPLQEDVRIRENVVPRSGCLLN